MPFKKKYQLLILLVASSCLFIASQVASLPPIVSEVMVTDVTSKSFCLVWHSKEPGTGSLNIFSDEDGLINITDNLAIIPHPALSNDSKIKTKAEDYGIMKVMVTGARPSTEYYVQTITTSKINTEITYYPDTSPFLQVTTMVQTRKRMALDPTIPVTNDSVLLEFYLDDLVTPAETGMLMIAKIEGAVYPVSAFIGDGIEPPYGIINLNNIYDITNRGNMDLPGGWQLDITFMKGIEPTSSIEYTVPQDQGLAELRFPTGRGDLNGDDAVNATDVQACINVFLGLRSYTDSADLDDDTFINVIDAQALVNIFKGYWDVLSK